MLDKWDRVTYPDGVQAHEGTIHGIYDPERDTLTRDGKAGVRAVLMATFCEENARAGRVVSKDARLIQVIDQLNIKP